MNKLLLTFTLIMCFCLVAASVNALESTTTDTTPTFGVDARSSVIDETKTQTVFGQNLTKKALKALADQLKNGRSTTIPMDMEFKIRVLPFPSPPSANNLDVCYEVCGTNPNGSFSQCYAGCSIGMPTGRIQDVPPFDECDALWLEYRNAQNVYQKMLIMRELRASGCMTMTGPVRLEIMR